MRSHLDDENLPCGPAHSPSSRAPREGQPAASPCCGARVFSFSVFPTFVSSPRLIHVLEVPEGVVELAHSFAIPFTTLLSPLPTQRVPPVVPFPFSPSSRTSPRLTDSGLTPDFIPSQPSLLLHNSPPPLDVYRFLSHIYKHAVISHTLPSSLAFDSLSTTGRTLSLCFDKSARLRL